jgi:hypothetical protein
MGARRRPRLVQTLSLLLLLCCCGLAAPAAAHRVSPTGTAGRRGGWDAEWAARRKGKLNAVLEALYDVAKEHSDVLEYYAYHPEAAEGDGLGRVAGSLLPGLSLLAQEGLDEHQLELTRREEALMEEGRETQVGAVAVDRDAQLQPAGSAEEDGRRADSDGQQHCPTAGSSSSSSSSSSVAAAGPARCAGPIPSAVQGRDPTLPFYKFVIVLASAPSHFDYRQTMRETWLSPDSLGARANETLVLFAVGQVREPSLEAQLVEEHARAGDLLRTPSYDGYRNLSLKVFEGYELVLQRHRFKWLVRCDDNNVVVMGRVLEQLETSMRDRDELRFVSIYTRD